jgi:hypothetical protein
MGSKATLPAHSHGRSFFDLSDAAAAAAAAPAGSAPSAGGGGGLERASSGGAGSSDIISLTRADVAAFPSGDGARAWTAPRWHAPALRQSNRCPHPQ